LTYYKRTQDGEVLQEIDADNMIRIIGGTDQHLIIRARGGDRPAA
jgi:phage tail tube protein FII